jgi:hypothetical protein
VIRDEPEGPSREWAYVNLIQATVGRIVPKGRVRVAGIGASTIDRKNGFAILTALCIFT